MKVVFSVLLIFWGIYFGRRKADRYKERRIILTGLYDDINRLITLMEYKRLPILNLIENLVPCSMTSFWTLIKEKTLLSANLQAAYTDTVKFLSQNKNGFYALKEEDKNVLKDFFSTLGKGDIDAEIKNAALTLKRLETFKDEAYTDEIKNTKMYSSLGLISGLAITLLIL